MIIHLKQQYISEKLFIEAKKYFTEQYIKTLYNKPNLKESLVSRFLLSKKIEQVYGIKNYKIEIDLNWKPIFNDNLFWSISHKNWVCFVWLSDKKIWVDIELIKERDKSILSTFSKKDYDKIGLTNRESFYLLWTAKESIIKYNLYDFDDIVSFELLSFDRKLRKINDIEFDYELIINCNLVKYKVISWINWAKVWSICC